MLVATPMETRNESNIGLLVTDDNLRVVNADSLSLKILDVPEEKLLRTPLARMLGGDIRLEVALLSTAMFRARFEEQIVDCHGKRVRVNAIPVQMETGDGAGLFITLESVEKGAPETAAH